MPDHEVHEIQLNGKQLVFMFMAATVVSVVIFLCGVLVGRGVRQPPADAIAAANTDTAIDPTAPFDVTSLKPAVTSEPAPAPENENLTYAERLEAPTPSNEPLKFAESKPAVPPPAVGKPAPAKAAAVPEPKPQPAPKPEVSRAAPKTAAAQPAPVLKTDAVRASSSFAEPPGKGFVLQVQAFPTRVAAEALAGRLKGKGYRAFVTVNPDNVPLKYRVRVGRYETKREAQIASDRLKQEDFKPWLTH
jgi:DedD protein